MAFWVLFITSINSFSIKKVGQYFNEAALAKRAYVAIDSRQSKIPSPALISLDHAEHGVLMIHGYSSSYRIFHELAFHLNTQPVSYYAPNLLGFGMNQMDLLYDIKGDTWIHQLIECYDVLASRCERVSVIGHSFGGTLALLLANQRQHAELVLLAPGIVINKKEKALLELVSRRPIRQCLPWLLPSFPKLVKKERIATADICDSSAANSTYEYTTFPLNSTLLVSELANSVDFSRAQADNIHVLLGEKDLVIDNAKTTHLLDNALPFAKVHLFKNSAHNLLEDYDKRAVFEVIQQILLSK